MSSTKPTLQNQLCAAVQEGHAGVAHKLLTEDGADPAVPGDGDPTRLPLYFAAKGGHGHLVKLLQGTMLKSTRQGSMLGPPRCLLYHANVRKAVFAVLVVVDRLEQGGRASNNTGDAAAAAADADAPGHAPLPLLPPELWLFILHFFQRSWWSMV